MSAPVRFPLDKLLTVYGAIQVARSRLDYLDPGRRELDDAERALRVWFSIGIEVDVQPPAAETFREHVFAGVPA